MSALARRNGRACATRSAASGSKDLARQSTSWYGRTGYGAARPAVLGAAKLLLLPLVSAAPLMYSAAEEEPPKSASNPQLWLFLGIAVALVLGGGVFAGLTIALMGQDETYLQVLATSGEGKERSNAKAVLKLLKKGKHWVLVTLLLSNVITNETLPIVLDRSLGGGWPAVLSSTVLIVIFGEIAPQSVCVRYGLSIGAYMAPAVLVFMWILAPIAWPTAKLLDYLLGEDHGTMYKKAGLKTLVQLHKTLGTTPESRLIEDEVNIINSVLDLKDKRVDEVMTPMDDVFTMSADTVLDERMMDTILSQGYSRIPIYAPDNNRNFIGMLLVKILITYDPEDASRVRDFALATLPETHPDTSCLDIINFFQEGKSHMVLVSDHPGSDHGALGVVTLEDVIEELIGEEIVDESDVFIDVHKAMRRLTPAETKRYRMSKNNKLVEIEEGMMSESEREGDKAEGEDAPLLKTESRKSSIAANGTQQAHGTTFIMRRKSSTASDSAREASKTVPLKSSNVADLRPHLKHLGPSNLAVKPRETRYKSVKIKPGVGTIPEGQPAATGAPSPLRSEAMSMTKREGSSERAPLLASAGPPASNGVAALQNGYGTNDGSIAARMRGMSDGNKTPPSEATRRAEENTTSPPAAPPKTERRPTSRKYLQIPDRKYVADGSQDENDELGEMQSPSRERSKSRRAARSGSITETTVDVGGLKKVVLDPHSSSNSDDPEGSTGDAASKSRTNLLQSEGPSSGAATEDDAATSAQPGGAKKKKKKKKGKKKGGIAD